MGTIANFQFEDVFRIEGRGVVLTGQVLEGQVNIGSTLMLEGRRYKVSDIEMFNKKQTTATVGQNVGILLTGADLERDHLKKIKGQTLTFIL